MFHLLSLSVTDQATLVLIIPSLVFFSIWLGIDIARFRLTAADGEFFLLSTAANIVSSLP